MPSPIISASFTSSWWKLWQAFWNLDADSFGPEPLLSTLLILSSIFVASFPVIMFLCIFWWMDRHQRVPIWTLSLTFFWGALIATVASFLGNALGFSLVSEHCDWILGQSTWLQEHYERLVEWNRDLGISKKEAKQVATDSVVNFLTPTFVAPLVEESAKAALLLVVITRRRFNSITDGFILGAAAGLGFGMTENFFHISDNHSWMAFYPEEVIAELESLSPATQREVQDAILDRRVTGFSLWLQEISIRTLGPALMHALTTSIVGAAIAWARFKPRLSGTITCIAGLLGAMLIHALWNGMATVHGLQDTLFRHFTIYENIQPLHYLSFALELLMVFCIFQLCVLRERQIIRNELTAEFTEFRTLNPEHIPFISARSQQRFAPAGIPQSAYTRSAIQLALRRQQVQMAPEPTRSFYQRDLQRIRTELKTIIQTAETPTDRSDGP